MLFFFLLWVQVPCTDWPAFFGDVAAWPGQQTVISLTQRLNLMLLDDLCGMSDEFDEAQTLVQWSRVFEEEQWPGDQLEVWDIDSTQAGFMSMMPFTSSWYEDLHGVMAFKIVDGDFIVSTRVQSTNRMADGAPDELYSLAGILIRTPRAITPATWTPGGENYIFLSAGAAGNPGRFQFEVKTTISSVSILQFEDICPDQPNMNCAQIPTIGIRGVRLGSHFILLRRLPGGNWTIHRRYPRPDMPAALQVGLTGYTDWATIDARYWPENVPGYNNTVITDGNPDLLAQFDYFRLQRPYVPAEFAGRDFSAPYNPGNPATISDEELLSFLGFD